MMESKDEFFFEKRNQKTSFKFGHSWFHLHGIK
jgi:hypothetical protein